MTQLANQQTIELSGKWKALDIQREFAPGPAWRRRIALLSHAGVGKTTWISSNPRTLILDFEDGAADVVCPAAHRISVRSVAQTTKILSDLASFGADPQRPFDVIAFDTLDSWVELAIQDFCAQQKISDIGDFGARGAGYARVRTPLFQGLDSIWRAGYGWICTIHLSRTTITTGKTERTVVEPALSESFRRAIFKRCQYLLYAERRDVPVIVPTLNPKTGKPYVDEKGKERQHSTGETTTEYRIEMSTPLSDDRKARVPLATDLVVTETNGWQVYVDAYDTAVRNLQERTGESR